MDYDEQRTSRRIYTIGHSNHPIGAFLGLLNAHKIEVLIDTRSSPFSRYAPQFNRESLKAAVQEAGIKYGFYGLELGGRPDGSEFYDAQGHVLYSEVAKSALFQDGLTRLMAGAEKCRVALLCSEENPSICHRRLLVSRVLFEAGRSVLHIRGNGSVQSEDELRCLEDREKSRQRGLFDEELMEEVPAPWKSIQSVLHKVRRNTSSDD